MSHLVRAVMFDDELRVVKRPEPEVGTDEVLIRLCMAGICNTDLEIVRGYKGFRGVLGHEFVGEVIKGPEEWLGQRVVGEINIACGHCDMCRAAIPSHCRNRRTLGIWNYAGAFADVFKLPAKNLPRVPRDLADEACVFVEPLAAACEVLESVPITPTSRVVLLGAGKLGLLVAQVLRLTGCDLSVIARRDRQKALLSQWGIRAVNRRDLDDSRADVVVECTGNFSGFEEAVELVRPRGTIVLKSTYAGQDAVDLSRIVVDEISVVGSRCGPFDAALRLLEQGLVDVGSLIDARYPLGEVEQAFKRTSEPGTLKVLLIP